MDGMNTIYISQANRGIFFHGCTTTLSN